MGLLETVSGWNWGTIVLALAATIQAVFTVLVWKVYMGLHEETKAIRGANVDLTAETRSIRAANVSLAEIQKEAARRDRASFRVATLENYPFAQKRPGDRPQVDFDVYNDGYKDSALHHAFVEVEQDGKIVEGWPIENLHRVGPGDSTDRMVRGGDYVKFRGAVNIPPAATLGGRKFIMVAVPVLDDGSNRGRTYFHPK